MKDKEQIRRVHWIEGESLRAIEREQRHSRRMTKKALTNAEADCYTLSKPRPSPVLGAWQARICAQGCYSYSSQVSLGMREAEFKAQWVLCRELGQSFMWDVVSFRFDSVCHTV